MTLPQRAPTRDRGTLPEEFQSLTGPVGPPAPPESVPESVRVSGPEPRPPVRAPEPAPPLEPAPVVVAPTPEPAPVPLPVAPQPAPSRARGRRPKLVAAVAGAAVLLVVAGVLVLRPSTDGDRATAAPQDPAPVTAVDSPLLLGDDAEYVETRVVGEANLLVTHWLHTQAPMTAVSLDLPVVPGLAVQGVQVTGLVVAADGARVEAPDSIELPAGWSSPIPEAHDVYVQYELVGALQRTGSEGDRALALLTALDLGVGQQIRTRSQTFPDSQVLTLACLAADPQAVPRPCGNLHDDTWSVTSEGESVDDAVIAQLELPHG